MSYAQTVPAYSRIRVGVRIRPISNLEEQEQRHESVLVDCHNPHRLEVAFSTPYGRQYSRKMHFDACLDGAALQEDVMHCFGIHQLLNGVLAGYSVSILAYGPTGSGKTHTMIGTPDAVESEREGIIQKAARYLLEQEEQATITASFIEVYNEEIYDLLDASNRRLEVRWTNDDGFHVSGATTVTFTDLETVLATLNRATKARRVSTRKLNGHSSRSHAVFTINVYYQEVRGQLTLVDLAGSERLKDSQQNREETAKINKSLFCLGKMMHALSSRTADCHVPYRDSILTKLLMQRFGGNTLTLLIACCSPCDVHYEETLNTLVYAQKAKGILNDPAIVSQPLPEKEMKDLRAEVRHLRKQNQELRNQLESTMDHGYELECEEDQLNNDADASLSALPSFGQARSYTKLDDSVIEDIASLKAKLRRLERKLTDQTLSDRHQSPLPDLNSTTGAVWNGPVMSSRESEESRNEGVIFVNDLHKRFNL